jgi:hypothetical protein
MSNLGVNALPRFYDTIRFDFMRPQGPSMPTTESSVAIPPALYIRDEQNDLWTLGFDYDEREWRTGKWEYDVVRNGVKTGDFARIIEFKVNSKGTRQIHIWGAEGWRTWTGRQFV